MKTVYQIRVEGPKRTSNSAGHFFSRRVFVSLEGAKAFAPGFEERCCGEGFYDLERVTDTKFVELELDEAPMILCSRLIEGTTCPLPIEHDGDCSPVPRICHAPVQPGVTWLDTEPSADHAIVRALKKHQDYVTAVMHAAPDTCPKED